MWIVLVEINHRSIIERTTQQQNYSHMCNNQMYSVRYSQCTHIKGTYHALQIITKKNYRLKLNYTQCMMRNKFYCIKPINNHVLADAYCGISIAQLINTTESSIILFHIHGLHICDCLLAIPH